MSRDRPVVADPWTELRKLTPARIALGRTGASLPTEEVLRFGVAHALARDAVHQPLEVEKLDADLRAHGFESVRVHSMARDRHMYLLRPDLGRRLWPESAGSLRAVDARERDLCLVAADGLSSAAVQRHAAPLLAAFRAEAGARWTAAPVVIAEQARVALGDEIGQRLGAPLVLVLLGERPGLSSPDSLGAYLTWAPQAGRVDSERNCVSNIRPQGLSLPEAAARIAWLVREAQRRRVTGIELKDGSELPAVGGWPTPALPAT
jgi:ethanolamine ammonia-lyase small subunit